MPNDLVRLARRLMCHQVVSDVFRRGVLKIDRFDDTFCACRKLIRYLGMRHLAVLAARRRHQTNHLSDAFKSSFVPSGDGTGAHFSDFADSVPTSVCLTPVRVYSSLEQIKLLD